MDKKQVKGSASDEKGANETGADKVIDDQSQQNKAKAGKQGSKGGAVLGDINDDAKKTPK